MYVCGSAYVPRMCKCVHVTEPRTHPVVPHVFVCQHAPTRSQKQTSSHRERQTNVHAMSEVRFELRAASRDGQPRLPVRTLSRSHQVGTQVVKIMQLAFGVVKTSVLPTPLLFGRRVSLLFEERSTRGQLALHQDNLYENKNRI